MALTCVHWYIARTFFNKDFNLVVAIAWTWITNVFTVVPTYYLFFLIGQLLLGRWEDLSGYEGFQSFWHTVVGDAGDPTSFRAWETYFSVIVKGWGLALLVGSIPFAAISYVFGYHWTLRIVRRWRLLRHQKRVAELAARRAFKREA